MEEYAILAGKKYDKHKVTVKGLFKQYGLTFNKGLMMRESRFVWANDEQSVEGVFHKDEDGNTTQAEFTWTSKEETQLKKDLKRTVIIMGGEWLTEKEESPEEEDELEAFDGRWKRKLIQDERSARRRGFPHSPILRPMVKEYLNLREVEFGLTDKDVDNLVEEIHKEVDAEVK